PFAARVLEPGVVGIRGIKRWVLCAAVRRGQTEGFVSELREYLPMLAPAQDVLEVGLSNVNPVVHVPGTLLNLGLVDAGVFRELDFYQVLVGRVSRVIAQLDAERVRLGSALGYSLLPLEEFDRRSYEGVQRAYAVGQAGQRWSEAANVPPRYIEEDVPMGLVPLASLARASGLRLPVAELMIDLACLVQGTDYRAQGRTLEKLGVREVGELRGEVEDE
ncbi:MAG: NAD/NADP octopine/nopaline dehydrogenase family protein, partial [Dehalococcoidia bacterium]|nr:NAD/NADP octopine/nopaline dehydrogenase family protein [Dehalococcoidia bacterium]